MIQGLNHITLAVSDLERAIAFYVERLGFDLIHAWRAGAYLDRDGLWLCLALEESRTVQARADDTHIAFSIEPAAFEPFESMLREHQVPIWRDNRSEGASVYFLDPDGHKLEVHVGDLVSRMRSIRSE